MNSGYRFRIYPNAEQCEYFAKAFGSVRFIYNKMLAERRNMYEQYGNDAEHKPKSYSQWKMEYEWLYEVDNLALANAQQQLNDAYRNFFKVKGAGFPRFRSKKSGRNSYTTNNQGTNIRIESGSIHLPKIGWVRIKQHRAIPETRKIKSCTISLAPTGKYFISIIAEYEREQPCVELDKNRVIGLDYSSPHFYVDSQGEAADMPHFFREAEERLAREQRKLSKMVRGSNNYEKQRIKVARAHEHVSNQRKDWLHKKSTELANQWDYVCVEDINLRGMAGSLNLGKSTYDNGFGMFREFLKYKLTDRGKVFIKIDKWFPSSKMCSACGAINKNLTLKDRTWTCECGTHHDRDFNAAMNIKKVGIRTIG